MIFSFIKILILLPYLFILLMLTTFKFNMKKRKNFVIFEVGSGKSSLFLISAHLTSYYRIYSIYQFGGRVLSCALPFFIQSCKSFKRYVQGWAICIFASQGFGGCAICGFSYVDHWNYYCSSTDTIF